MTKEQLQSKLQFLPLNPYVVDVEYGEDEDNQPVLDVYYHTIPGPGMAFLRVPLTPTAEDLKGLADWLPLPGEARLASLAILLAPSAP